MIVMVIFAIKLVCVASVCVTPASGTSGDCSDLLPAGSFDIHENEGFTPSGEETELSTANFSTIGLCVEECESNNDCYLFDYNCLTGDCVQYTSTGNNQNIFDQLVTKNAHITGFY